MTSNPQQQKNTLTDRSKK